MNQAERLQEAIRSADAAELEAACRATSQTLARCAAWTAAGAIREAAALNADAGNVIGLAVRLTRNSAGAPSQLHLPDAELLETLTRIPADAAAHRDLVANWVDLNLREAPLDERLAAIRRLHLAEPTNIAWKCNHQDLEEAAVRLWEDEVTRCVAAGDPEGLRRLGEQIDAMGFLGRGGQRMLHALDAARIEQQAEAATQELAPLAVALHLAWAAMDVPRARQAATMWRRAAEAARGDHGQDVGPIFHWIESEDRRVAADLAIQNRIDDLVRALDELEPLRTIERRYAALRDDDAVIPPAVETRVAHRIAEERRRRTRSFVVALVAIIAFASVVTGILLIRHRSIERTRTITNLAACIEQNLRDERLLDASDCWNQAVAAELTDAPLIAAHKAGIDRAAQTLQTRAAAAALDIEAAGSLLERDDASLLQIAEAIRLLEMAEPYTSADSATMLRSVRSRADMLRVARLSEARAKRGSEFAEIEAILATDRPAQFDRAGWEARTDAIRRARHMLVLLRDRPAADQVDLQDRADRLAGRIEQSLKVATARVERIEEADRLIDALHTVPRSECRWHETWDDLLENHAALLSESSTGNWDAGRARSRAACAAQRWRETVLPILRRAGLWGEASETTQIDAGRAKTSLQTHLDQYGMDSPYRFAAERLLPLAEAAHHRSLGGGIRRSLESTGLLDLHVASTKDGYRYLRPLDGGWRRIDSRADLTLEPRMLKPLSRSEELELYSHPTPAAISVALQEGLDSWEAQDMPTTAAVCELLRFVQESKEGDQLLLLAANQELWTIIVDASLPLPVQSRTEAEDWLATLGGSAPAARRADWPAMAPQANAPIQLSARRQAGNAASQSPGHEGIRALADLLERETRAMSAARTIRGLLIPDSDGSMRVHLLASNVFQPEVLQRASGGWQFLQINDRLAHDERINAPQGVPMVPVIIFGKQ